MKETLPRSNTKSKRNIDSPSFTCENSVKLFVMFCLTVLYFLLIGVAFLLGLLISSNSKINLAHKFFLSHYLIFLKIRK